MEACTLLFPSDVSCFPCYWAVFWWSFWAKCEAQKDVGCSKDSSMALRTQWWTLKK